MKKISLIAGLAMLVTVGGVFAAWQFGSYQNDNGTASIGVSVDGDVVTKGGAKMTLTDGAKYSLKFAQSGTNTHYLASGVDDGEDKDFTAAVVNDSGANVDYSITATVGHKLSAEQITKIKVYMNFDEVLTDMKELFEATGTLTTGSNDSKTVGESDVAKVFNDNVIASTITDGDKVTEFNGLVTAMQISIAITGTLSDPLP